MSNEQIARERAEAFRLKHDLGTRPLGDLFELAHTALDSDALAMDAGDAEHGLSMLDPVTDRVVIVVATTRHPMRQRSSLAHEMGHVVGGDLNAADAPVPGARTPAEIQADAFARHLLLPVAALRDRFGTAARKAGIGDGDLAAVVQEFEASPAMAAIQFKQARLIDPDTCAAWMALSAPSLAARYGWLSQYQALALGSMRPRAPQQLMRRAVEGYHQGAVGIAEVAAWYEQAPEELAEQLGAARHTLDDVAGPDDVDDDDAPLFPPGFASRASSTS
ncbi:MULTISPECIES: ImmA/IrrE family metallo-endopeptidase [unclassified Blastococcus]